MNVNVTEKQAAYIAAQIASGDFQNASEVVRDALRLHEYYRHKQLEELRAEINKAWDSAPSGRSVQDLMHDIEERLRKNGKLPSQ